MTLRTLAATVIAIAGCGGEATHPLPPETVIDSKPDPLTNQTHAVFQFHAEGIASDFQCTLDGATSDCTPPFSADLVEGMHHFEVAASDRGTVDDSPATYDWQIDTTAPDTTILTGPPPLDNSVPEMFTFSGSDTNDTFECAVDDAAFAACTSPQTVSMTDGDHVFHARAIDPAGNVDPTPATLAWTLDTATPDTAITAGPADGSTSGPGVSFSFTSPDPTATFECSTEGGAFAACTSPVASTLPGGTHMFAVRAKDVHGVVDPSPAARAWTVDATPPPVTIDAHPTDPTNDTTPTFAFSSTDATATFECEIDAGAFAACTSPFTGPALTDGSHTFRVRATDPFGNQGVAATFTWTIDTVAPTVTITSGPTGPTNDPTPSFAFTTAGAPITTQCRVDTGTFAACTSPTTTVALADGPHVFEVQVTDAAGNSGNATRAFTVDTVKPVVAITSGPANPTNATTATFTFTTTEGTLACKLDAGTFAACTSPKTFAGLVEGSHTFTAQATDAAGNVGSASMTWTVDLTAPTVTITSGPTGPTNDSTPSFGFTTSADAVTIQCKTDAGALANCTSPFTTAALADGAHSVTVVATDAAGNPGSATRSFSVDTTGPQVVLDSVPPQQWPVNYFDVAFHSPESGVTFTCSLNGAAFTACTSPISITTTYGTLSKFSVRGADALGNPTTQTTTWTSVAGLVLHYPYEQGSTKNTSLLVQVPADSPDGSITVPIVGGWAGTAAGSPKAHAYKKTIRPLSSSANGSYTASVWIRPGTAPGGTIWSNATATDGITVTYEGRDVVLKVLDGGQPFTVVAPALPGPWYQVAVTSSGPGNGVQLWIDGVLAGTAAAPTTTGFDGDQSADLVVGALAGIDLDDLRFYNVGFTAAQMCTVVARGVLDAKLGCIANRPGYELDMEGNFTNTGFFAMTVDQPKASTFVPGNLGQAVELTVTDGNAFLMTGLGNALGQVTQHSFTLWTSVSAASASDTLISFVQNCLPGAILNCGAAVSYVAGTPTLHFSFTTSSNMSKTLDVPIALGDHTIVVTEQLEGNVTQSATVYVDGGAPNVVALGSGALFTSLNDRVLLPSEKNTIVDEYEFWPRDLSADPEMLCENGFDGEFDPVTGTCSLTSN